MEENKDNKIDSKIRFKVLNFASDYVAPKFCEDKNGKWINYGSNNDYPEYLLDIYNNKSNKHKAIIHRKVMMTSGNGVQEPATLKLKKFMENKWGTKPVEDIIVKANYDYEIFGGFAVIVKWSIDGTKVVSLDHVPFHKLRQSTQENKLFISRDWSQVRKKENTPIEYNIFDPTQSKEYPTQIFYHINDSVGIEYYPLPYYSSTLNWLELDFEIGNYQLNATKNGFNPGFLLNFATGIPSDEEMDEAYRTFEKEYTTTYNANKFILSYCNGKEEAPEISPIPTNDTDERFLLLQKSVMDEILIGHAITTPLLFGVKVPGELGGKTELLEGLAIFQSTYIKYNQLVLEKQFNKIAEFAGVQEDIVLNKYEIDFSTIEQKII